MVTGYLALAIIAEVDSWLMTKWYHGISNNNSGEYKKAIRRNGVGKLAIIMTIIEKNENNL